jgi:iron complex transport system substrate-binding protein
MRTSKRLSATMRSGAVLAAVAAAAALAGCSSASSTATATRALGSASAAPTPTTTLIPHWPVTVTPTSTPTSAPVTIDGLPKRIVSLDPTATEDLYAVGAGAQVVAVDQNSDFPPGAPVTTLSSVNPDIGAVVKYDPSLVISRNDPALVRALNKLGIPLLVEPEVSSLRDAYQEINQIGQATGHAYQASETVAIMRQEITKIAAQAGTKYSGLTYYWETSSNPYESATSATLIGHIMDMFGLRDIADGAGSIHPRLSVAYIAEHRPQIIFLADTAGTSGQTPAMVAARAGWADIRAVRDNDVFALNADIASRWGPRLPQLVAEIASALASFRS